MKKLYKFSVFSLMALVLIRGVATGQEPLPRECVAFVVGVESYDETEFNRLKYVGEDAYRLWARLGALTKLDRQRSVLIVADREQHADLPEQAKAAVDKGGNGKFPRIARDTLRNRLEKFLRSVKDGELVIVYFGGHGLVRKDADAGVYFLPSDFKWEDSRPTNAYRMKEALDLIRIELNSRPKTDVVFFASMCHAGDVITPGTMDSGEPLDTDLLGAANKKDTFEQRSRFAYFPACAGTKEAFEREELKGCEFTNAVLKGLGGGAKNELSEITTGSLMDYVRQQLPSVPQLSVFSPSIVLAKVLDEEVRVRRLWTHSLLSVATDLNSSGDIFDSTPYDMVAHRQTLLRLADQQLTERKKLVGDDLDQLLARLQIRYLLDELRDEDLESRIAALSKLIVANPPAGTPPEVLKAATQVQSMVLNSEPENKLVLLFRTYTGSVIHPRYDPVADHWSRLFGIPETEVIEVNIESRLDRPGHWDDADRAWRELINRISTESLRRECVVVCAGNIQVVPDDTISRNMPSGSVQISFSQLDQLFKCLGKRSLLFWDGYFGGEHVAARAKEWVKDSTDRGVFVSAPGPTSYRRILSSVDGEPSRDFLLSLVEAHGFHQKAFVEKIKEFFAEQDGQDSIPEWYGRILPDNWIATTAKEKKTITGLKLEIGSYGVPDAWWSVRAARSKHLEPWQQEINRLSETARQLTILNRAAGNGESPSDEVPLADVSESDTSDPFAILSQTSKQSDAHRSRFWQSPSLRSQIDRFLVATADDLPVSDPSFLPILQGLKTLRTQLEARIRPNQSQGKVHFVSVAAQEFQSTVIGDLRGPSKDMVAWQQVLESALKPPALQQFRPEKVARPVIEETIAKAVEALSDDDTLLFVYSGRGYQAGDGERFIALEDTEPPGLLPGVAAEAARPLPSNQPWRVAELLRTLSGGKGRRIVIFDCQFSPIRETEDDIHRSALKHLDSLTPPVSREQERDRLRGMLGTDTISRPFQGLEPDAEARQRGFFVIEQDQSVSDRNRRLTFRPQTIRIPSATSQFDERFAVIWWHGNLPDLVPSMASYGVEEPIGSPLTAALTQALLVDDENGKQIFSGTIEEWVEEARSMLLGDFGGGAGSVRSKVFNKNAGYGPHEPWKTQGGFTIQGCVNRRIFASTEIVLPIKQLAADWPRRRMNLQVAREIYKVHQDLLRRPIDRLTNAILTLIWEHQLIVADEVQDSTELNDAWEIVEELVAQWEKQSDLFDSAMVKILLFAAADIRAQLGYPDEAAKQLAFRMHQLERREDADEAELRFQQLVFLATQRDSDRFLEDVDERLGGPKEAREWRTKNPLYDRLRDGLKQFIRYPDLDSVPMIPSDGIIKRRAKRMLGGPA